MTIGRGFTGAPLAPPRELLRQHIGRCIDVPGIYRKGYANRGRDQAKRVTIDFTAASGQQTIVLLDLTFSLPFDTDAATTAAAMAALINSSPEAGQFADASSSGAVLTVAGRYVGGNWAFTYTGGGTLSDDGTNGSAPAAVSPEIRYGRAVAWEPGMGIDAIAYPSLATAVFRGVALGETYYSTTGLAYPFDAMVLVATAGKVAVEVGEAIAFQDPVYYQFDLSTNAGRFFKTAGSDRVQLAGAYFASASYLDGFDNQAAVLAFGEV